MTSITFVTGLSGSGKSALSRRLAARGERAISLDAAEGLCSWQNRSGEPVHRPDNPDHDWLSAHAWCWHGETLNRLVTGERASGRPRSFLCGIAANQRQFHHRFDVVVMLDIPIEVMLIRLDDTSRGNDFGATWQLLIQRFDDDRAALLATADYVIDATAPIDQIADSLCGLPAAKPTT